MNTKEKSRPLVTQETGQMETAARQSNLSEIHCNIEKPDTQGIFELLPIGESRAISSRALAEMTGCKSIRDLQSRVAIERAQGKLILSSCRHGGGYYRPSAGKEGREEIAAFVRTLRARALHTLSALKAAKAALAEIEGQLDFTDLEVV